jgi:PIN domain nuclease of toxin-antitoxin system
MRVLLDSHALIWWLMNDRRLPAKARKVIADDANEVLVSAVSAYEVVAKHRAGRLPEIGPLGVDFVAELRRFGFERLPLTMVHGQMAASLPGVHRDPFDRMLIAQALEEKLAMVSNELLFDQYGVKRIWS